MKRFAVLFVFCLLTARFGLLEAQNASRPLRQFAEAQKVKVGIFLFPGVQIIDYTGPFEVFGHAGFDVFTVARTPDTITTAMGMSVNPKYTFENHPVMDILMLPGGDVPDQADPEVLQWIQKNATTAKVVFSVCNGAFYLAQAGLLDGLEATTFASLIDSLQKTAPKARVVSGKRYVDNGKIITSAGLSSGIDGALHVVEKLLGKPWAQTVATSMEYNWDPAGRYVRAQLADRYIQAVYPFMQPFDRELTAFQGNTDTWSVRWNLRTNQPSGAVLDSLNKYLQTAARWKQTASTPGGSRWSFSGARGEPWTCEAGVAPSSAGKDVLSVDLRVSRAVTRQSGTP